MVKIPIGKKVQIDFWDNKKGTGMINFRSDHLEISQGESSFQFSKGDFALVIESSENYVKIIPLDKFSRLLYGSNMKKIDLSELSNTIKYILEEGEEKNGGILSIDDIYKILIDTSIKHAIKKKSINKAMKIRNASYFTIENDINFYSLLFLSESSHDLKIFFKFVELKEYFLEDQLIAELGWNEIRNHRLIEYLINKKMIRKEDSYRTGLRYYLIK